MSQQYSLRWNNHQPNFISMFTNLLNTQTLVDVTLAADGKHLQAHKVVLSACSSYFQALFVDNPSQHPIVILKDVSFADLRTMVDFMYYGEVNVTEEQLPQVLDTAKHLKIKGLTEMPDSTSLTRSQGGDLQSSIESESQRLSASPPASPTHKRRKGRKSSTGSTSLNMVGDDRVDAGNQTGDIPRSDTITLSSVVRRRDMHTDSMNAQQATDQHNMNVEQLAMDANAANLSQGGQWSMMEHTYPRYPNACLGGGLDAGMYGMMSPHVDSEGTSSAYSEHALRQRRTKFFKRQCRVPDDRDLRKQVSEPAPSSSAPSLQKHESYPQYSKSKRTIKPQEQNVGSLLIRAVTVIDRQSSSTEMSEATTRASHTPAVRSGPPLSCNFCWNTVDDCGRILRRKTQYHCPECRTNLCIVPCFHEYHDGTVRECPTGVKAEPITCKPSILDH